MKLELGAIEFSAEFKNGELVYGSPRIKILQDNMREVAAQIPNGKYQWVLTLDLESATRADVASSIQQVIDRGWVECPNCVSRLAVNAKGDVTRCTACGDEAPSYWNLFIQTH